MKIFPLVLSILILSSTIVSVSAVPATHKEIENLRVTYDLDKKSLQVTWTAMTGACVIQVTTVYFVPLLTKPTNAPEKLYFPISCDKGELTVNMNSYQEYPDADFLVHMFSSTDPNAPWQILLHRETLFSDSKFGKKCVELFAPNQVVSDASLYSALGDPPDNPNNMPGDKVENWTVTMGDGSVYQFYGNGDPHTSLTLNHPFPANVSINNSIHERVNDYFLIDAFSCEILTPPQSCNDCIPPTLGVMNNGKRVVDNGFTYNGQSVDVERWYTPFPLITATIGEMNLVEIKVFENLGINNMKMVQFGLGLEYQGQPLNDLEVLIEVHLLTDGTKTGVSVEDIIIIDKENLIENASVSAVAYAVKCQVSDKTENCVKVDLYYSYREATINNMMLVSVSDKPLNTQNFYFNEGVNVIGESLNPPLVHTIFNEKYIQYEDVWLTFTRVDKVNDIWTDQNDIKYHKINDNTFDRITAPDPYVCADPPLDEIMNGGTRNNCHFRDLVPSIWKH